MKYLALTVPGESPIQAPIGVPDFPGQDPLQSGGYFTIRFALHLLFWAGIILSLFYFIYGGYRWMTSGGDPEKKIMARQTLIYAIVGLFIVLASFTIMGLLSAFFGINLLNI